MDDLCLGLSSVSGTRHAHRRHAGEQHRKLPVAWIKSRHAHGSSADLDRRSNDPVARPLGSGAQG